MASIVHVTAWEKSARWKRILCAFLRVGILIALLDALISLLGPPLTIFYMARWEARKMPFLTLAPKPLSDYSVSTASGTTITHFGYRFEVPWNGPYKTKQTTTVNWFFISFDSGQVVVFIAPPDSSGLFSNMVNDRSEEMKNLGLLLGDLTRLSAYDQYRTLLETTPSTIRAFGPRPEAVRGMTLLMIKALAPGPGIATGSFSFAMPDKRGFQLGDPQKSARLQLEVFGEGNRWVEILLSPAKNAHLTQPEINRILTTLRPLPDKPSAPHAK
jgi:hypothetical protein